MFCVSYNRKKIIKQNKKKIKIKKKIKKIYIFCCVHETFCWRSLDIWWLELQTYSGNSLLPTSRCLVASNWKHIPVIQRFVYTFILFRLSLNGTLCTKNTYQQEANSKIYMCCSPSRYGSEVHPYLICFELLREYHSTKSVWVMSRGWWWRARLVTCDRLCVQCTLFRYMQSNFF